MQCLARTLSEKLSRCCPVRFAQIYAVRFPLHSSATKTLVFSMADFFWIAIVLAWQMSGSVFEAKREERNAIVFPDYTSLRKQEIPLSLIRRLNEQEINSVQDFIEKFVEPEPNQSVMISRMGLDDTERNALKSAKMAKCMPELKTVALAPEKDSSVFYYPSCTRVERCGGCCAHRLLTCQPVESEVLHFSVVVAEYKGGSQLKFRNKEVIGVEQHKKCKCDCKVQKEHCGKYQKYNKEKCSCECDNNDDERKCYEDRHNKIWNRELCSCMCREELECGSGFYFDPFHCRCEPALSRRRNLRQKHKNLKADFSREFYNVSNAAEKTNVLFRTT